MRFKHLVYSLALLLLVASSRCALAAEGPYDLGVHLLGDRKYEGAIEQFTKALASNPRSEAAYEGRARAFAGLESWRKAADDYSQAIRLNPKSTSAYHGRAEAHEALKEYKKAIADVTEALMLSPYSFYYGERARMYAKMGETKLAEQDKISRDQKMKAEHARHIADCDRAIAKNPRDAHAYQSRGTSHFVIGEHAQSVDDITRSFVLEHGRGDGKLTHEPMSYSWGDDYPLSCRAQAYAAMGRYEEALKDYDSAIGIGEMCIRVQGDGQLPRRLPIREHLLKGTLLMTLKRWEEAAKEFTSVIETFRFLLLSDSLPVKIDERLASAYNNRAQAYEHAGKLDLAIQDRGRAKRCSAEAPSQ